MDLGLAGKKVAILGGTRGIGRATAEVFADEGASVAICARDSDPIAMVVASHWAKGAMATCQSIDVSKGAALQAWVRSAAAEFGGLDIPVSNAGAMAPGLGPE